ncbi:MAG: hypothetical protein IJL47_03290 [Lachnospiraceae bacterium]|nr:hypothetical protein [Lachnospiraceae bacterium]
MLCVSDWRELSLRERIGQTVVSLSETEEHIRRCGSIEAFCKRYPIGGLFNNRGLVKGLLTGENPDFAALLESYNQFLRVPLIGTADRGAFAIGTGNQLLPQMALGAADDEEAAYQAGEYMARDCRLSGVHWVFWPICDLNISPLSPITNIRAVSDDPERTAKIVSAELKALKDGGVAATLKHYPGSPYNETMDPHLSPIDNETPISFWRETYGKLYTRLFEEGAPAVMTGHINLSDYQKELTCGSKPPATLSQELTTDLLRGELGFRGVTVTDALVMGGFQGTQALENTIRSFLAGNDVLLWPAYEYIDRMEQMILSGEIGEERLNEAVDRIWKLKAEYGVLRPREELSETDPSYFSLRSRNAARKCLTLLNNRFGLLPASPEKVRKIAVIAVTPDDGQAEELEYLKTALECYGAKVSFQRNVWTEKAEKLAKENDLIIFALCRTPHRPIGPLDFWGEEATSVWASNCTDKRKTLAVSFGSPYFYRYYKNSGVTYVNAYSTAKPVLEAFAAALFGKIPFSGDSPVRLD